MSSRHRSFLEGPDAPRLDTLPLCGCHIEASTSKKRPHAFFIDVDSQGDSRQVLTGATADESNGWQRAILRFANLPSVDEMQCRDLESAEIDRMLAAWVVTRRVRAWPPTWLMHHIPSRWAPERRATARCA